MEHSEIFLKFASMMKRLLITILSLCCWAAASETFAQDTDTLYEQFVSPGREYAPRVWWHWMNGNVTREGIRKDLEWMDRSGIGGFHQFNCRLKPEDVIVDRRVELFSKEWDAMFAYALDVADSLGLEVSVAASPGWSITGGPWVSMDDAQKKLTWQQIEVEGPKRLNTTLPEPYEFSGPFQDTPQWPKEIYKYKWYRDIAVVAVQIDGMSPEDTVAKWKNKAGFEIDRTVSAHNPPTTAVRAASEVIDITKYCKDGILNWKAPRGRWRIYRFGCNLLGRHNGPVEEAGVGLEADKLSAEAMERYFRNYLGILERASGGRLGTTVKYLMIDSYEAGKATWTPDLPRQFRSRRGYDLIPWLPVLTGCVVGSARQSDDFLYDWRRTLGELICENHYDLASEIAAQYGMKVHAESHEAAQAFIGDGLRAKRGVAVPMGAIWVNFANGWESSNPVAEADIHESASAAHIYGGNICAAESFSVNSRPTVKGHFPAYQCHPGNLKPIADAALSEGLNRFVMHCSPHCPVDDSIPGLGLGSFGNWFNRNETWAEQARPWHDYLARCCFMLQQGEAVKDIAYFYGEDTNATARFNDSRVPVPQGYDFDFVNADALMDALTVQGGRLVSTASGMSYSLLVIDCNAEIRDPALQERVRQFEGQGLPVLDGRSMSEEQLRGAARAMLAARGIPADFEILRGGEGHDIRFAHRSTADCDIYWIANISREGCSLDLRLRSSGLSTGLWNPERVTRRELPMSRRGDGSVAIDSLVLEPYGSRFIVLSRASSSDSYPAIETAATTRHQIEISGPWNVEFQQGRGAPSGVIVMDTLACLSENSEPGIKYFSGTAAYSCTFTLGEISSSAVTIDLGEVHDLTRLFVNGKEIATRWHAPFTFELAPDILHKGENELRIEVTNVWANRMIGDAALPGSERITYTPWQFYTPDTPLLPSGLLGPVAIQWR